MTQGTTPTKNRRRLALLIAAPVLAAMAFLSWGLSTPVGGTPDDDFHLSSIWCGSGVNEEGCATGDNPGERSIARDLVIDSVCFAFNPDASAACQGEDFGENPADVVSTGRGNFGGLYPPVFYFAMSQFAGGNIETSVLAMKAFNSVLAVGVVGLLFWLLPLRRRPTLLWGLALTVIPLGMFLIPSTNPSGWAVLSAGTLWIAILGYFESSGWRKWGLAAIALASTLIGAGARADAALFSGLALLIVVMLTARRDRSYWMQAAFPVGLMIVAGLFYLSADQSAAISTGLGQPEGGGAPVPPLVLAIVNIVNVPSLWAGALGQSPLGWLDTALPGSVGVAVLVCVGGAIFLGLRMRMPRKNLALGIMLAVLFLFPTVLLVQSQAMVGAQVQPRYLLPLIVIVVGLALLQNRDELFNLNKVQIGIVVAALSLANAAALHANFRRYVGGSVNLDDGAEWWWNLPVSPMVAWIAGSLAFAGLLAILATRLLYADRERGSVAEDEQRSPVAA